MRALLGIAFVLVASCSGPPAPDAATAADAAAPVAGGTDAATPGAVRTECLPGPAPTLDGTTAPVPADALDEALAGIDCERDSLGLSTETLALSKLDTKDARMLAAARAALWRPTSLPAYGRHAAASLDEALASTTPVTRSIVVASALREAPVDACVDAAWDDVQAGAAPLAVELALEPAAASAVPLALQRALVPILRAARAAASEIAEARAAVGAPALLRPAAAVPTWLLGVRHFEWTADVAPSFERIDAARIVKAAASVAYAVERAHLSRFAGLSLGSLDLDSPLGPVILRGPGSDTWAGAPTDAPLLLLDTGGDDVYRAPVAAATLTRPVSLLVDLGGQDTYGYDETAGSTTDSRLPSDAAGRTTGGRTLSTTGRQGSGTLGVGLLFDLGGQDDIYRSLVASQGAGSHGVGVLYDDGGDDRYESEGFSQGAGAWGVGLLLDASGNDHYTLHNSGQAFGFTRGVGALVDASGDDRYRADPGPSFDGSLLYESDQLPGFANHSFAQGCGAGHRPDWPDAGYPFPGGIGLLRDARGDDTYVAGVFAQGCGFVQGLGALLDGAGNDTYEGLYYVQGAAAHVGAALLLDAAGNDRYNPTYPVQGPALGIAHDLSIAVQLDTGGDDTFRASWAAFGAALANGIALSVHDGGSDRFEAADSACFGNGTTSDVRTERTSAPTVGIFVKAGGAGTYVVQGKKDRRSGRSWHEGDGAVEIGIGLDRPNGHVTL